MTLDDFQSLVVARYELKLRARQTAQLPQFLGSMLRGAFGHALKQAVCVMPHRQCHRCMLADKCSYPYLFETPAPAGVEHLRGQDKAPHPFILATSIINRSQKTETSSSGRLVTLQSLTDGRAVRLVPPGPAPTDGRRRLERGDELTFGLLLMGRAIEYLPYIVFAVSEMARNGLGVDRSRFELNSVTSIKDGKRQTIYTNETGRISASDIESEGLKQLITSRLEEYEAMGISRHSSIALKFLTPTRIRIDGGLQSSMNFDVLVRSLLRRVSLLSAVHGSSRMEVDFRGLISNAAQIETGRSSLKWYDWERYSNRQQTKMNLGGFIGEIEYTGEAIEEFLPLIAAGEILHVGAGTGFGLGRYEVVR